MKLAHADYTDISQGVAAEGGFTLRASATAFYVLMSGIAKDKVGYPVREICTNAWDAARGDFEVHLPTVWDETFRVRDYGSGLSHEQIRDVYTQLFNSTKNDSNESVGGLGLGCKSPFAYLITSDHLGAGAGSFMVRSFQAGTVRTYIMSIGNDGSPRWQLFATDATTDRDGLEVSFTVRNGDRSRFREAVRDILWSFEPRPQIEGIEWDEPEVLRSGNGWVEYAPHSVPFRRPNVRMGCVRYEIDLSALGMENWPWTHIPILFNAPIGSLSVQASRESLAYDDRTIATLKGLVTEFERTQIEAAEQLVAAEPSYLHACWAWENKQTLTNNISHYLREKVKFGGLPLRKSWKFKTGELLKGTVTAPRRTGYLTCFPTASHVTQEYPEIHIGGLIGAGGDRIKILYQSKVQRSLDRLIAADIGINEMVLWVRGDLPTLLAEFGLVESDVINLDNVTLPKQTRRPTDAPIYVNGTTWEDPDWDHPPQEARGQVEVTQGGFYAHLGSHGRRARLTSPEIMGRKGLAELACLLKPTGLLLDFKVAVVRPSDLPKMQKHGAWTPAWPAMFDLLESAIDFTQEVIADEGAFSLGHNFEDIADAIAIDPAMPKDLREFAETFRAQAEPMDSNSELYAIYKKVAPVNPKTPVSTRNRNLVLSEKFAELGTKYPLLGIMLEAVRDNVPYRYAYSAPSTARAEAIQKMVSELAMYFSLFEGTLQ